MLDNSSWFLSGADEGDDDDDGSSIHRKSIQSHILILPAQHSFSYSFSLMVVFLNVFCVFSKSILLKDI